MIPASLLWHCISDLYSDSRAKKGFLNERKHCQGHSFYHSDNQCRSCSALHRLHRLSALAAWKLPRRHGTRIHCVSSRDSSWPMRLCSWLDPSRSDEVISKIEPTPISSCICTTCTAKDPDEYLISTTAVAVDNLIDTRYTVPSLFGGVGGR
jgi:hypothetical protein